MARWLTANAFRRVVDPATGETIAEVANVGAVETRAAIDAAGRALPAWRALTAKQRADLMRGWFNLIMEAREDLAQLMTAEQGKPLAESRGEVAYGASFIEWFAEEGKRAYGDVIPSHAAGKRILVIKEPIGRGGRDHPLELPHRHDHPQGGARAGRRLHLRDQAVGGDAALRPGAGRAGRSRRHSRRAC